MKVFWRLFFSRALIIVLLTVLQLGGLIYGLLALSDWSNYLSVGLYVLSIIMAFRIIVHEQHDIYKISWVIFVLVVPVVGGVLYLVLGTQGSWKKTKDNLRTIHRRIMANELPESKSLEYLQEQEPALAKSAKYLYQSVGAEIYCDTESHYLPEGDDFFEALITDLKKAKKFIFFEFFIIQSGKVWDEIVKILEEKAAAGVEVRVLYDDAGSLITLPDHYLKILRNRGIKAQVFNRMRPFLDNRMNNRDHRKIAIIDGVIGLTGGVNIADQYANIIKKHGYWKDGGVRLEGRGVWGLTRIFLESWNTDQLKDTASGISQYLYRPEMMMEDKTMAKDEMTAGNEMAVKNNSLLSGDCSQLTKLGLVQPFGGQPYLATSANRNAYLNLIALAREEIIFTSPYLVLDEVVQSAFQTAAQSGVKVKIIVPRICDHWYTEILNQANYLALQKSGVEIYEFEPGFIHTKSCLVDGKMAIIGSSNLDCRSFYVQFEDGVWLYKTPAVSELKHDLMIVLGQSNLMRQHEPKNDPLWLRLVRGVLEVLAPLM